MVADTEHVAVEKKAGETSASKFLQILSIGIEIK